MPKSTKEQIQKNAEQIETNTTTNPVLRRSSRIAAMNSKSNQLEKSHVPTADSIQPTLEAKLNNIKISDHDKENDPPQVPRPFPKVNNCKSHFERILPFSQEKSTQIKKDLPKANTIKDLPKVNTIVAAMPTTPVSKFRGREGISTPSSLNRRNSSSPHPHNFLHKLEDPLVQRIDSPVRRQLLPPNEQDLKTAKHFTLIVEKEDRKFKTSCERWNKVLEENTAPEAYHGLILSAIGQANLFQNKRFKQFKELIELHKDKFAEKKATVEDLDGFWEMISIQVDDVHKRFEQLEKLSSLNWVEEGCEPKVEKKKVKVKEVTKKTSKPVVSSKFKLFRQQMMAKKQSNDQDNAVMIF